MTPPTSNTEDAGRTPSLRSSVPGAAKSESAGQTPTARFPRDNATDAHFCPQCGEPEVDASVEAFEIFGEAMCADCAADLFATTAEQDDAP